MGGLYKIEKLSFLGWVRGGLRGLVCFVFLIVLFFGVRGSWRGGRGLLEFIFFYNYERL